MLRRRSLWMLRNGLYLWSSKCKIHTSVFPVLHSKCNKDLPNPNLPTPLEKAFKADTGTYFLTNSIVIIFIIEIVLVYNTVSLLSYVFDISTHDLLL